MSRETIGELRNAILELNKPEAVALAKQAIADGQEPTSIVEGALRPSLEEIGRRFEAAEIFLPELVAAGSIAQDLGNVVESSMSGSEGVSEKGSIAIGTVRGDVHSIGKNIVAVMMRAHGFRVVDLGTDVATADFVSAAADVDAVGLSGLLTTATNGMETAIREISAAAPDTVIIAGGAAMNPELAKALGVLYGTDAASGVRMLDEALQRRSGEGSVQ